jgi:hypothetical protein
MQRNDLSHARRSRTGTKALHRVAKQLWDATKRELSRQEAGHCDTVGSDQGAWSGTTCSTGLQGNS